MAATTPSHSSVTSIADTNLSESIVDSPLHPSPVRRMCSTCRKLEDVSKEVKLQICGRCKQTTALYCSKECQKQDWKQHKQRCADVTKSHPNSSTSSANGTSSARINPAAALLQDLDPTKWSSGLSQMEVYRRVVDAYRLRCEDDYAFGGNYHGLYAQEDPLPEFRQFIKLANKRKLLPPWWNPQHGQAIVQFARTDPSTNLKYAVEKTDIQEKYHDSLMPMKLRVLAEQICGGPVGSGIPTE